MDKIEFRDWCIKHNLPFAVEFKKPWYPKFIEIPLEAIIDAERSAEIYKQILTDVLVYGISGREI